MIILVAYESTRIQITRHVAFDHFLGGLTENLGDGDDAVVSVGDAPDVALKELVGDHRGRQDAHE